MEKDQSEIEVGSDLEDNSTIQEDKTSEDSLAETCVYKVMSRAIKEGKPYQLTWEVLSMKTANGKRGLLIIQDDEPTEFKETDASGSGKRRRVEQDINETGSGEGIVLPFEKTKAIAEWKMYESDEVYKRTPQRPHFRPLFYSHEFFREFVASYLTGFIIDALKKVDTMGEDTPRSTLDVYKDTFDLLEDHGFDVKAPVSLINELLSVKNGMEDESSREPKLNKGLVRCRSFAEDKGTAK